MSQQSIGHPGAGLPETILDDEPPEFLRELGDALSQPPAARHAALSAVAARFPASLDGWARLGQAGRDLAERYAAFRVGYHRGLDRLRRSGWRGTGYVRWEHPTNRGFLRSLEGLRATAEEIGEHDEAERCGLFLRQLDPSWPPADLD